MQVPTQNWVQRSDKRQADRLAQKSFQNLFNDQFLNILQLQVVPSWAEKKTVPSHCSGDLSPFSYAYSHEWTLLWVQIVSVDYILGRRQFSFLIPSLLSFVCSPFLSTIQLFLYEILSSFGICDIIHSWCSPTFLAMPFHFPLWIPSSLSGVS